VIVIYSGGQTGADRAALDWAICNQLRHGGWCPKGRIAEDGVIPRRYHLNETSSREYAERTEKNVIDADGTVIFTVKETLEGGSLLTSILARKHRKPFLHLHDLTFMPAKRLAVFLADHQITILNVAGSRASHEPGVGAFVASTLDEMLRLLQIP